MNNACEIRMEATEIISLVFGVVSAPVSLWIQKVLLHGKYKAEIEQLRAEIEASKTDTRGDELENVKKAMAILMEQVVEPLKKEIHAIRKEVARLRRAVEKVNSCPHADRCPVRAELQKPEDSEPHAREPTGA